MNFDFKFLDDEVRERYLIPAYMKRAWAAEMEVLRGIDKICKDNNINYYVDYGTLLGAVRHKGFIPWDDDIDICMLRKDYDRFCDLISNMQGDLILRNLHNDDNYQQYFCRIVNTSKFELTNEYLEKYHGFPYVVGVDIFPLDNLPDDMHEREKYNKELGDILNIILLLIKGYDLEFLKVSIAIVEKRYGIHINRNKDLRNQLFKIFERVSRRYNNQETKEIADIYEWWRSESSVRKREWYSESIVMDFENIKVVCPKDYHNVLTNLYGDYKEPVLIADGHEFPFYDKVEKLLLKKGVKPYYSYEMPQNNIRDQLIINQSAYESIIAHINLLKRINENIVHLYSVGDYKEIEKFLEKSQTLAIRIGNTIENNFFDYSPEIISLIENYCDNLYYLACDIEGKEYVKFLERFKSVLMNYEEILLLSSVFEKMGEAKKIAFVFDRIQDWNKYKEIAKLINTAKNKVFVIPIPYYEKDNLAQISNEHFEGDLIDKDVEVMDYKLFEEMNIVFDIIVTSNPFDNISLSSSINPFFYAKNLQKYAKKIVHIPTFEIMDFEANCTQMVSVMKYYAKSPAVVNADYVYVGTNKLRERYIEALQDFTKDDSWKEKIMTYNSNEELVNNLLKL